MSRHRGWACAGIACAVWCAAAGWAHAGGWTWPVGSRVSVPFGASWTSGDGVSCTHRGVDIPAGAGDAVRACTGGTVAFCGPVPSAAGGQVLAVTLATPDGLKVTFMPLESARVATGECVAQDAMIGSVAPAGDGSSAETHLHLSVKRGELPIDPATLLASAPTAPATGSGTSPAGPGAGASGPVPVPAPGVASGAAPAARVDVRPQSVPSPTAAEAAPAPVRASALPVSRADGRAVHALPPSAQVRGRSVSFRPPALAKPTVLFALELAGAGVSAMALWAYAYGRRVPSIAGSNGSRG